MAINWLLIVLLVSALLAFVSTRPALWGLAAGPFPFRAAGGPRFPQQRLAREVADILDLLGRVWPLLGGAGLAVLAVLDRWRSGRKEIRTQHADLVKIAQDAASGMIGELREELTGLRGRLKEAESEIDRLRARQVEMLEQHTQAILTKDADIALLRARPPTARPL